MRYGTKIFLIILDHPSIMFSLFDDHRKIIPIATSGAKYRENIVESPNGDTFGSHYSAIRRHSVMTVIDLDRSMTHLQLLADWSRRNFLQKSTLPARFVFCVWQRCIKLSQSLPHSRKCSVSEVIVKYLISWFRFFTDNEKHLHQPITVVHSNVFFSFPSMHCPK